MKIRLKDLWIGERVRIKSKDLVGTFEGQVPVNLAKVKVDGLIHFVPASDLEIAHETEPEVTDVIEEDGEALIGVADASEIDLHIEKLHPAMQHRSPEEILSHQLNKCREFLDKAARSKAYKVTIIHGKGTGALKSEVLDMIYRRSDIANVQSINNGGATEVYFYYTAGA